ncbi:hypothetical protein SH2C18_13570 [Clostridium sediminicola]|uniref:hypothetical protein n=1 Tax=Clostridium sediminicola TaxID=3114879 RepID=UPI0031F21C05
MLDEGLVKEVTQDIIDVIICNILKGIESTILIEAILKIVLTEKLKSTPIIVRKAIESKFGTIKDNELVNEINRIKDFDDIDVIVKKVTQLNSLEATKKYIKKLNSV